MRDRTVNRLVACTLMVSAILAPACSAQYPRRDPTGERFPSVQGQTLAAQTVRLPDDVLGTPVLLFVGYEQSTQFDIDRWALALRQAEVDVRAYEVPTIPGLGARLAARSIDAGMRSGIPREDWNVVVTLYDDAGPVARFTGNENGLPARVLLVNDRGHVVFFHDEGYSLGALGRLERALANLKRDPR